MKSLNAPYLASLNAQENKPRLLYELYLDSGTLYLADTKESITFDGQAYTALAVEHESAHIGGDEAIDSVTVSADNVGGALGIYVLYEAFRGRLLVIKRVFENLLTTPAAVEIVFSGAMQEPIVDQLTIRIEVVAGQVLKQRRPLHSYTRRCRHELGDDGCTKDISADTIEEANAPDSGSTTTLVDNNLTATADLYTDGSLEADFLLEGFSWTEKRRISAYDEGTKTITVALPFSQSTADATRWKATPGCDKTWEGDCYNLYFNVVFYGGFMHVR